MQLKRKYKIDLWSRGYKDFSAYYRPWWWPFWLRCYGGTHGMCNTLEIAENQAKEHSKREIPKYLDL